MAVDSYELLDELRAKEYTAAKQANAACKKCRYFLHSIKFLSYCSLKRKYIRAYNFCSCYLNKELYNELKRNPLEKTRTKEEFSALQ